MTQTILITGGAGYIGSHAVKLFLEEGYKVIVFDNLSNGYKEPLDILEKSTHNKTADNNPSLTFIKGDLRNREDLKNLFQKYKGEQKIDAVIHFAALCSVDESMKKPELYFENNTLGSFNLFEEMRAGNVKKIIFSSTCAIYGEIEKPPVAENHPIKPNNPYGESKLLTEKMLQWYGKLHDFKYTILRYFNVCGADKEGIIGDSKKPSLLLMQNAVRAAMNIEKFEFTCPKVDTPDKTPIRDYIDVEDLVIAHKEALNYLDKGGRNNIFNLGNGTGYSVKEIVQKVEETLDTKINAKSGTPRKGEYAQIYANPQKAFQALNWTPQKTLTDSINSLATWYKKYPHGYKY